MQRCYGCMKEYGKEFDVCPHCGYVAGTEPESKSHLKPGTVLAGKYMLGRAIGHGGFGITYIAWEKVIQKTVAIKEFFTNAFSTRSEGETAVSCYNKKSEGFFKEGIRKMLDEAKRLSRFSSNENVVDIIEYFEENNTAYIVMEYLEGKDLKKYLEENGGRLEPKKSVEIILPVLNALEDMHKEKLIHRDISPDNIYLCNNGKVKLLDFGSARLAVDDSDKSLSVMVKRGYTPQEQYASHSKQGPWTDVYAVCATLYKIITGDVPSECLERDISPLKRFAEYGITGYEALEEVVFMGLEPQPEKRTQTAAELAGMLRAAGSPKAASAAKASISASEGADPGRTPKKNNTAIIVAVTCVCVIFAAVAAIFALRSPDNSAGTESSSSSQTEDAFLAQTTEEPSETVTEKSVKKTSAAESTADAAESTTQEESTTETTTEIAQDSGIYTEVFELFKANGYYLFTTDDMYFDHAYSEEATNWKEDGFKYPDRYYPDGEILWLGFDVKDENKGHCTVWYPLKFDAMFKNSYNRFKGYNENGIYLERSVILDKDEPVEKFSWITFREEGQKYPFTFRVIEDALWLCFEVEEGKIGWYKTPA